MEDDASSSCPVCKEHFTDGTKIPACLKCGHVLCRQCAFTIMRNNDPLGRVCPICRSPSTFSDVRIIYVGSVRIVAERRSLELENQELRDQLRCTEKEFEKSLRALKWFEKEHVEKCGQRSKMLSYYQRSSGYLYRKMRYYRDNWYRLRHTFQKLKVQRNRMNSELTYLRKAVNYQRLGASQLRRRQSSLVTARISAAPSVQA